MSLSYKCACYAYLNLYLEKYGYHFRYFTHEKFIQDYHKILSSQNYSDAEINEVSKQLRDLQNSKRAEDEKALKRFQEIKSLYKPKNTDIFTFKEEYLDESFLKLVNALKNGDRGCMERNRASKDVDVFTFPVFTSHFIQLLLDEISHLSSYPGIQLGRPNSMNYNGVLMTELGLDELLTVLREKYLQPIVDVLFPQIGPCDSHRGFTVKYSADGTVHDGSGDKQLGKHYDNSEVTLNVCLQADNCRGSNLVFLGLADGTDNTESGTNEKELLRMNHQLGQGFFHLGRQKHYVTPIEEGVRTNLVLWLRSSQYRNKQCPMCWDVPEIVQTKFIDDGFRP